MTGKPIATFQLPLHKDNLMTLHDNPPSYSRLHRGVYLGAMLFGLSACAQSDITSTAATTPEKTKKTAVSATASNANSNATALPGLSPSIPLEITVTKKPVTLDSLQHDFDVFSWQTFVALNWPANADGSPNTHLTIGDNPKGSVVWQHWRESRGIFLPDGAAPAPWGQSTSLPAVCQGIDPQTLPPDTLFLTQIAKTPNVLDESAEPFQTGPLIDQNGKYTRYEILTNQAMFEYIVDNKLYNKAGQKAFNADADFTSSNTQTQKVGAIMIKASWIEMGGKYNPKDFHTAWALVYNNPDEHHGVKAACSLQQVGLVGFHIAHKTEDEPQWVWSTFEHVANVPTQGEPLDRP